MGQPQNWYTFASGYSGIYYGVNFAQGGRFRADVYIARGNTTSNKALFDALAEQKDSLKNEFGEELEWERLDDKKSMPYSCISSWEH